MCKAIAFGADTNDDFEFGELYHVCAVILCEPTLPIAVSTTKEEHNTYVDFLKSLGAKNVVTITPAQYAQDCELAESKRQFRSVRKTADFIADYVNTNGEEAFRNKCFPLSDFDQKVESQLSKFLRDRLDEPDGKPGVLVWIRNAKLFEKRNSTNDSINQLLKVVTSSDLRPILIGHELDGFKMATGNLIEFYKDPAFQKLSIQPVRGQLQMFRLLNRKYAVRASIGMMSGGIDGPAFFSDIPECFFAKHTKTKSRMDKVCKVLRNFKSIKFKLPADQEKFQKHSEEELASLNDYLNQIDSKVRTGI